MATMLERIYAGFLGMNAGIRLGAPVEPAAWDFDRIAQFYGEIRGYVRDYKNFAADDDVNGPVYFLRGLLDNGIREELTPQAVGEAWLNYARDGIGLYWWGGEGVSTEHTAYLNLKKGIPAPRSGSIEQNGIVLAEQIGGQIFIDTWGLINLGDPHRAAQMAAAAASVSHDGNGLYGAAFMAACIAAAYTAGSVDEILDAGLAEIPADSTYAAVVGAVRAFHAAHPGDWRSCMRMLISQWGYDKYTGVCHIIPNAGVCILSMVYGGGDFARTIEIASMCGWDTDCNAGNVGTILGVYCGLEGIADHYRKPMNDFIALSGVSGCLNNLDVPTYCKFLYQLYRLTHGMEEDPGVRLPRGGEQLFDFSLPGSTHGLRLSNHLRFMTHTDESGLKLIVDRVLPADNCDIYYKPFYRRHDFDDERYKPVFSPTVYSGQTLRLRLVPHVYPDGQRISDGQLFLRPYIRTAVREERYEGAVQWLESEKEVEVSFRIPDTGGDCVAEVGFHVEASANTTVRLFAMLELKEMTITGKPSYRIATALCREEFLQQTPFSLNHGAWRTDSGALLCSTAEPAQAFTGNYYATDVALTAQVTAAPGTCVMARAAGTRRYLAAGFLAEGKVGLRVHEAGAVTDYTADFPWEAGRGYETSLVVRGSEATLILDGEPILTAQIPNLASSGMVGFSQECPGSGRWRDLFVRESGPYSSLIPQ
ncbi:MAG: ADP-ribosylglycohydrolase family protein [Oscillospiraceae bacterium]|nr:ADP-ribosylglycohydrolase family protein [Oscillospiraceae bacterium]